jgi:TRAP-type C4-dicarboxylate transport system permease small subunit
MKKFYEQLCVVEGWIARVLLVGMVLLIFAAAVARLMALPINWALDIATAMFAWACLFAADVAWRNNKLMCVEILINYLSERGQVIFRLINHAILTVFLVYVIPTGLWLSWVSRARSFQGIPDISYSWVTMAMPVGGALLLITTLLKVRDDVDLLRGRPARQN